jgi:hypothetical protein
MPPGIARPPPARARAGVACGKPPPPIRPKLPSMVADAAVTPLTQIFLEIPCSGGYDNGEERTTKYAEGAKRQARLLFAVRQSSTFAYFAHFVVKIDFR